MITRFIIDLTTGLVTRSIAGAPESDDLAAILTAGDTMECEVVFMAGATDVTATTLADDVPAALGVRAVPGVDPLLALSTPIILGEDNIGRCTLDLFTTEVMALAATLDPKFSTKVYFEAVVGSLTVAQVRMMLRCEVVAEGDEPPAAAEASRIAAATSAAAAAQSATDAAASAAATGTDAFATAADRFAVHADRLAADADAVATATDRTAVHADRLAADADAAATAADRLAVAADRSAADADAAATAADRVAVHADKLAADADAAATAADRIQTGADRTATAADKVSTAASASAAAASAVQAALSSSGLVFVSDIAGGSVPATATASGYFYVINAAGASQSKTWAVGDFAIYKGTSGQWSQIPYTSALAAQLNAVVSATRNALAPRGGVIIDGTSPGGFSSTLTNQNIGTEPFSVHTIFEASGTQVSAAFTAIWYLSLNSLTAFNPNAVSLLYSGTNLSVIMYGSALTDYNQWVWTGFQAAYAGKRMHVTFVRNASGNPAIYVNGLDVTGLGTFSTGGTPPTWQGSITSTYFWGGRGKTDVSYTGSMYGLTLYIQALTASDVLEIFELGGAVPARFRWGSLVNKNPYTNAYGYGAADSSSISSIGGGSSAFTMSAVAGQRTGGAGAYVFRGTANDVLNRNVITSNFPVGIQIAKGQVVAIRVWIKGTTSVAASIFPNIRGSGFSQDFGGTFALAQTISSTWAQYMFTVTAVLGGTIGSLSLCSIAGVQVGDYIDFDDLEIITRGAALHLPLDDGIGYQLHDASSNELDAVMTTVGLTHAIPVRRGFVRGTLTWAGTHEGKSLLGQRAFPDGFVLGTVTLKPTVSTSGSGSTLGTSNSATRWRGLTALTANAKAVATLANQLPAGTTANDADLVLDPDTANYTGSISLEAHYAVTSGT
ncbi:MAG: hypothetical protein JSS11_08900 [Verrucomicrobia bacterium]|nr:hypothetical protein [Verrucomicrobiota bacterium]